MKRSVKVPKFSTWFREVMNCRREKNKALFPWIRSAVFVLCPPQASAPGYQGAGYQARWIPGLIW